MPLAPDIEGEATIDQKVAFLSAMPGVSQVIETHMAYVFLTASSAFKLKKPVSFGYFDHRTLSGRATACSEEMRLNRALAGRVYIEVLPLTQADAQLTLGGEGRVVDWLVHMRRLPADRMLDVVIAAHQGPSPTEVAALVAHLAHFYRQQQTTPPPAGMYFAHLRREQAVNAANLTELAGHLPGIPVQRIVTDLSDRIEQAQAHIADREKAGLVIEGHGDLRPEHVCLTDPLVIFDRVETAREMRVVDVFDEVGYLAAECAMLGRPDLVETLLTGLRDAGFAPPVAPLVTTYAMFRLVTRARLSLDHLRDPDPRTPARWIGRTQRYLAEVQRLSDAATAGDNA